MAFEWFRSWHGAPTDAKYRVIARRAGVAPGMVSAVYWALLDYASQNEPRGSVEGFDTETYAEWAGWEESDVLAILDAFTGKQAIIDGRIVAWEKRQPKREDPTGAERQARYRDAQRNASNVADALPDDVTQSNATSRDVTQSNPRLDKTRSYETTEKTRKDQDFAASVAAWEAGGQTLSKTIADDIGLAIDDWRERGHPGYVADAITEAARQGKLTWKYVEGILKRCARENVAPTKAKNGSDPAKKPATGTFRQPSPDGTQWIHTDMATGKEVKREPRSEEEAMF